MFERHPWPAGRTSDQPAKPKGEYRWRRSCSPSPWSSPPPRPSWPKVSRTPTRPSA